jgi:hypothetical protein
MRPEQRCTIASVAGHAMHERANPFYEYFLGGHIDMSGCRYEQYDERTVRVTGTRCVPAIELRVKLEGSGKIGERYVGIVGVRDPHPIAKIDLVTAWRRPRLRSALIRTVTNCTSRCMGATQSSGRASLSAPRRGTNSPSSYRESRRRGRLPKKCA